MYLRTVIVLLVVISSGFGWEIGARMGIGLPAGGFETYNGGGFSGAIYGAVGAKVNLEFELCYTALADKYQGYELSFTNLNLAFGYPIFNRENSASGVIGGAGVAFLDRSIGEDRESGSAVNMNFGARLVQRQERVRFNLELLPSLLTDGKGWAAVISIRLGVGYEI